MSYYIGIDLGTSSVKAYLVDNDGKIIRENSRNYSWNEPNEGWKEISTETWWDSSCEVLLDLLRGLDGDDVKAIGVTGQMHSIVMLDKEGKSLRPVMMWNDTRTAGIVAELKAAVENTDVDYLANIISTGSPAANMLWVKKNEPDIFKRLSKFLIGPDYIVYKLTGKYGTDYCEASTSSLYDTYKLCWSDVMRDYIGLSDDVYPKVRESTYIVGEVVQDIAKRLGLGRHTVVIAGTGDNPAASIPTGCLGENYPVFSIGTSGVLMFPRKKLDYTIKGKNILFSFDKNCCKILVQGVIQSCGASYRWWNDNVLKNKSYTECESVVDINNLGSNKVMFYPHLSGDKTIYSDPTLRGAFIGIGTDTKREDMTLAVMEGVAFALRQLATEMQLMNNGLCELRVIGGGSKSYLWMQILADVLKIKIVQMDGRGGAGYGVALLAAYACGEIDSPEQMSDFAKSVKTFFEPREYNSMLYDEKYNKYIKIHDALAHIK